MPNKVLARSLAHARALCLSFLARPDSARGAILGKVLGVHLSDALLLLRLLLLELPQAAHHAPITARRRRKESRQPCKRQTPGTDAAEA